MLPTACFTRRARSPETSQSPRGSSRDRSAEGARPGWHVPCLSIVVIPPAGRDGLGGEVVERWVNGLVKGGAVMKKILAVGFALLLAFGAATDVMARGGGTRGGGGMGSMGGGHGMMGSGMMGGSQYGGPMGGSGQQHGPQSGMPGPHMQDPQHPSMPSTPQSPQPGMGPKGR